VIDQLMLNADSVVAAGEQAGLGLGLAYSAMTSVIVAAVAPEQTGAATGMNTNIRNVGGAIGLSWPSPCSSRPCERGTDQGCLVGRRFLAWLRTATRPQKSAAVGSPT
jgi:hypothetical protein